VRIVSLFPAATEIIIELGLRNQLVGLSHSCPRLDELSHVPRLSRFRAPENASAGQIDSIVRQMVEAGEPLYEFDSELFLSLKPEVVLVQSLCHVCAIDENSLAKLVTDSGTKCLGIVAPNRRRDFGKYRIAWRSSRMSRTNESAGRLSSKSLG
jgi:hypothetical protein